MNQQQQDEGGLNPVRDARQGANLLYLAVSAYAITIYLLFRYGSGREHTGFRAVLGMLVPVVFMLFVPDPSVVLVWPIYLVGLLIHRFGHWRAARRRDLVHTQYQGTPWLAMLLFRQRDPVKAWTLFEPLLAAALGLACIPLGEGLALYYLCGSVAMFVKQLFENVASRKRLDKFHDAMIENEHLMSQTRGLRRFA